MKIAILLPNLRGGGVERTRLVLAREFCRLGHTVEFVLGSASGELLSEAREEFKILDVRADRARALPSVLARYLRARRPDVLVAAMWPYTLIAPVARLISGHRCLVLVSEHNSLSVQYRQWGWIHGRFMRWSMALAYRLADARVGVSVGVVEDISAMSRVPKKRFSVINNPVPPRPNPSVDAISRAERLWSTPRGGRVLTVGSLKAQKNHKLLVAAFARLSQPTSQLMIVGSGVMLCELLSEAKRLAIEDRVIFAGFHLDPSAFYQTADLFVLSSDYEGFGNVVVEALASGTPVVSTDCPSGPAEILEGGLWGRLVPVGDADALASAMSASLVQAHDHEALKRRAADFSPEIAANKYLKALNLL